MQDWSWAQISADINTRTVAAGADEKLPKVNVYFEDKEAADFFAALDVYKRQVEERTLFTIEWELK